MESFSGYRVLGFDTETTGLDPRKDRIVQYAFVGVCLLYTSDAADD